MYRVPGVQTVYKCPAVAPPVPWRLRGNPMGPTGPEGTAGAALRSRGCSEAMFRLWGGAGGWGGGRLETRGLGDTAPKSGERRKGGPV